MKHKYNYQVLLLSRLLSETIPISEEIIINNTQNTMLKWQDMNSTDFAEVSKYPLPQQLQYIKEMFLMGKKGIKGMLKNPDHDFLIDIAYERSFHKYLDHFQKGL